MSTTIEMIKQLREATGAGVLDCRMALEQANTNPAAALAILQEQAAAQAARRAGRETAQGTVEVYSHGGGRIGVMVEVGCETDFAARSPVVRGFAHELALQIAAADPLWVADADIPAETLREEEEKAAARARAEKKPEALIPRITAGHIEKFKNRRVLLRQVSIRDDALTVAQMLDRAAATTGERITVRRFARWEIITDEKID